MARGKAAATACSRAGRAPGSSSRPPGYARPRASDARDFGAVCDGAARPARTGGNRPPLAPGDRLGGYRLLERLGRGGQGDVWKALRREPFVELVALKVLKPSLAHDPVRMAQFRREAERGGRLAGPSLLPVYELIAVDGYYFMAMPYVEGITLREVVRARIAHLAGKPTEEIHRLVTLDEPDYLRAMTRILGRGHRGPGPRPRPAGRASRHQAGEHPPGQPPARGRLPVRLRPGPRPGDRHARSRCATVPAPRCTWPPSACCASRPTRSECDIYSMGVTLFEALTLVPALPGPRSRDVLVAAGVPRRRTAAGRARSSAGSPRTSRRSS